MSTSARSTQISTALLVAAMALASCGSEEANPSVTTSSPLPPAPGTVTLEISDVADAAGLVLLSLVGTDLPARPFGAACAIVDADDFEFAGTYRPIIGDDPCTVGAEPLQLQPGSYEVIVAVLPGGSRTAAQCTKTTVTVDGDVTVEVAGLGPGTDCDFSGPDTP